jgi:hypothetical protein
MRGNVDVYADFHRVYRMFASNSGVFCVDRVRSEKPASQWGEDTTEVAFPAITHPTLKVLPATSICDR